MTEDFHKDWPSVTNSVTLLLWQLQLHFPWSCQRTWV